VLAASNVVSDQGYMPLTEVRPGMKGHGLTVFKGSEPERFDVEVIDVLHGFRPGQDLVLIRTDHPTLAEARSVAGMSGSPVYLEDRLIGAYAYGWSFGLQPLAGVTPIRNMLDELQRPLDRKLPGWFGPLPAPPGPVSDSRQYYKAPFRSVPFAKLTSGLPKRPPESGGLRRLNTPLLLGGMPGDVATWLGERLAPLGWHAVQATGGAATDTKVGTPKRFENGGAIAVQLLRGDIRATGVGTVTQVHDRHLLAFGHPMMNAGQVALPTAHARVLHIMASRRLSFKMAEALLRAGTLVNDRQAAIVVDTQAQARTLPIRITVRGAPGVAERRWSVEAAQDRRLTPGLVMGALASALRATASDQMPMRFTVRGTARIAGHGSVRFENESFGTNGVAQLQALLSMRMLDLMEVVYENPFELGRVEELDVEVLLKPGIELVELMAVHTHSRVVNPGSSIDVTLRLRPFGDVIEERRIQVPIPRNLAGQEVTLKFDAGDTVQPPWAIPRDFDALIELVNSSYPASSLVVSLEQPGRGLRMSGHVVENLPASMLDAMMATSGTRHGRLLASQHRQVIDLDRIVTGEAKLKLEVRKQAR